MQFIHWLKSSFYHGQKLSSAEEFAMNHSFLVLGMLKTLDLKLPIRELQRFVSVEVSWPSG